MPGLIDTNSDSLIDCDERLIAKFDKHLKQHWLNALSHFNKRLHYTSTISIGLHSLNWAAQLLQHLESYFSIQISRVLERVMLWPY
jgi:hypothetical protein